MIWNRYYKTHPFDVLPEYEESIYIDGNMDMLDSFVFECVKQNYGKDLQLPLHYKRNCIYDEIKVLRGNKKISSESLNEIERILKENYFPKHYGLNENNLIFRRHSSEFVKKIMEEWWYYIEKVAPRDQVSLAFVLWRNGVKPDDVSIPNLRLQPDHVAFYYGTHR